MVVVPHKSWNIYIKPLFWKASNSKCNLILISTRPPLFVERAIYAYRYQVQHGRLNIERFCTSNVDTYTTNWTFTKYTTGMLAWFTIWYCCTSQSLLCVPHHIFYTTQHAMLWTVIRASHRSFATYSINNSMPLVVATYFTQPAQSSLTPIGFTIWYSSTSVITPQQTT